MPTRTTICRRTLLAGALALAAPLPLRAQGRQVTIVVPFPPGGTTDIMGRLIAQKVGEYTGDSVVVENRPGANGNIGSRAVAQARPDGTTWLVNSDGIATVNPPLYGARMGFDPAAELTVVGTIGTMPSLFVVNPRTPWRSVADFVAHARTTEVPYASGGIGSGGHLTMEYLASVAGLKLSHVPYRGGAPAMTDLVAGQVPAAFVVIGNAVDQARSGALRPLAVSSLRRVAALPDVPTMVESGFPGFEVVLGNLVWVPARTPPEIAARVSALVRRAVADPVVQERLRAQAIDPWDLPPEEATRWLATEHRRWAELIAARGIRGE
jgi:tripartite-type tricarboxylate transporter receptor subunit TctC